MMSIVELSILSPKLEMKRRRVIMLWVSFALVALLTWVVYLCFPSLHFYRFILLTLATINLLLGLWILIEAGFAWRRVFFVVLGLTLGQWWLIIWLLVFLVWCIRGFAP